MGSQLTVSATKYRVTLPFRSWCKHCVALGKGMLRVLLFALEDKVGGRLPTAHPAFAWLVGTL